MHVDRSAKKVRTQLKRVLSDGRVTKGEAKALAKTAKKGGVSKQERKLLHQALVRRNDAFEPDAQRALAKVARFKPGANIAVNAPQQVKAEFKRLSFDKQFDEFDANALTRRIKRDGVTEPERAAVQALLDGRGGQMDADARRKLEAFVADNEPLVGPTTVTAGGMTIQANGVRQSAIDAATRIATELTVNRPDIAERLRAAGVKVVIIPANAKLTDLPEFASLKGTYTFDGRLWDDVRGVANVGQPDGTVAVAIAEENLSRLSSDDYGNESVGIHEIAHVVLIHGVSPEEHANLQAQYDALKARGGPFPDDYAGSNVDEFFAEMSASWFNKLADTSKNAEWIRTTLPDMYATLQNIYGPPRQIVP